MPHRIVLLALAVVATTALTPKGARLAGVSARGGKRTKRAPSSPPPPPPQGLAPDVIGVLDFECTCAPNTWDYQHEIIEFPVVLVDVRTKEIFDEPFHRYVRPTENATLSEFCTELTGIAQATVDASDSLENVLAALDDWLGARGLGDETSFALATDGWDLERFLDQECRRKGLVKPGAYLDRWVDLSKAFSARVASRDKRNGRRKPRPNRRANLATMLKHHQLTFEGSPHSGIDDARNIARVAVKLLETDGEPLRVNDGLAGVDLGGVAVEEPEAT